MSDSEESKTPIEKLGKYGLIDHLTKNARQLNKSSVSSIGDDSAIINSDKFYTLVTSDLLLEGIHFNLVYTPLKHLGYKSVIRAISDIYAMNGKPGQVLISLGISSKFSVEQISELYEGIYQAISKYGVDLAGGDTTSSLTGLTIGVTATGTVEKGKTVRRSGASPNDLICVTGDFGAAYMGLQLLEREMKLLKNNNLIQPDLAGYEYIIGRQLKPEFPFKVLEELNEKSILPTSMIDVSDGLASDLLQICKSSAVGCRIFNNKIPIDAETVRLAEEFRIDPVIPALNGGEDYELLFTVPLETFKLIKSVQSVRVIGHITQSEFGKYIVADDGSEIELKAQGWRDRSQNKD
jgi:thiamine-monophosphate kinase